MILKSSVAVACFLPGRAKDLSAPLYNRQITINHMGGEEQSNISKDMSSKYAKLRKLTVMVK